MLKDCWDLRIKVIKNDGNSWDLRIKVIKNDGNSWDLRIKDIKALVGKKN